MISSFGTNECLHHFFITVMKIPPFFLSKLYLARCILYILCLLHAFRVFFLLYIICKARLESSLTLVRSERALEENERMRKPKVFDRTSVNYYTERNFQFLDFSIDFKEFLHSYRQSSSFFQKHIPSRRICVTHSQRE